MATKIKRNLILKFARFRVGRRHDFTPPALHELLLQVHAQTTKFSQRHFPPPTALPNGQQCVFIKNIAPRTGKPNDGVIFEVCAYTYGLEQDQFRPDFDSSDPDIQTGRVHDEEGEIREILHTYRCVALGQALIVENNRGAGGLQYLSHLLAHLFNRYCDDTLPGIELMDVVTKDLDHTIEAGGGVQSIDLKLVDTRPLPKRTFVTKRMNDLRESVPGAKQLKISWVAEDSVLSAEAAVKVAQEWSHKESPLEALAIRLKDGQVISSLETYRAKREIEVQVTPEGALAVSEIETGLWHYLDELRMVDSKGWRVLDDQGNLVQAQLVPSKRR
ncbi:hypothetical protein [Dyella mobilis]|uniref:Uncharacterized protein n=1 Tax=Dyella mobilis TaxID=1849582 RepID=A0ABS2KGD9_9GAMM|nr:hypothetical protein [Dyella mobilis]MBM7129443.1 hypothetical protein [Dyella mobilis]